MTPLELLGRRLMIPLSVLTVTLIVGTAGFRWLWRDLGGTWLDALFMTVTTVTTIGYGEVKPLDSAGRVLSMLIALGGIGSVFYTFGVVMEYLASADVIAARKRRRKVQQMQKLEQHVVVAGFGRVGRQTTRALLDEGIAVVVIDPRTDRQQEAEASGALFLLGDATSEADLQRANIGRARGLVVTTHDDATNLLVVLTARMHNPRLFIVSRAVDEANESKLMRAGANRALSPYAVGGRRMAHLMVSPNVVDFFDTALRHGNEALSITEFKIGTAYAGRRLRELNAAATGAHVLTVIRSGQVVAPADDLSLDDGDHLLALGTAEQLARLSAALAPPR